MQQKSKPLNKSIAVCSPSSVFHWNTPKLIRQSYHKKKNHFKVSQYFHKPRSYVPSLINSMYVKKLVGTHQPVAQCVQLPKYGLDNQGIEIQSTNRGKTICQRVQIGCTPHPPTRTRLYASKYQVLLTKGSSCQTSSPPYLHSTIC